MASIWRDSQVRPISPLIPSAHLCRAKVGRQTFDPPWGLAHCDAPEIAQNSHALSLFSPPSPLSPGKPEGYLGAKEKALLLPSPSGCLYVALRKVLASLTYMEEALSDGKEYLMGNTLTEAACPLYRSPLLSSPCMSKYV